MIILDGKKLATEQQTKLRQRIKTLATKGIIPGLAVVVVGDNPASAVYVKNKQKLCKELGLDFYLIKFPATVTADKISQKIKTLNKDSKVHGIIVQLPLPPKLDAIDLISEINPQKDIDGLHPISIGLLALGKELFIPATPKGVMDLLQKYKISPTGKNVVIIGFGYVTGMPLSLILTRAKATVTVAQDKTKTSDLVKVLKSADIVISAVGKPGFIKGSMIKSGATIIDIGITKQKSGWAGDVDFASVSKKAKYLTPVPGGVGPLTVSSLISNLITATEYWGTGA